MEKQALLKEFFYYSLKRQALFKGILFSKRQELFKEYLLFSEKSGIIQGIFLLFSEKRGII